MRIIAGQWKGKSLISPDGKEVRPTSERTREALFNILMHLPDNPLMDQPVADICCGSGALGLEALSRGAASCLFIDNAPSSLRLTQQNIQHLGAGSVSKTLQANASQLPPPPHPFSLVLMDPPYQHTSLIDSAYASLRSQGWLRAGSVLCFEQSVKATAPVLSGCEMIKQRHYGRSEILVYAFSG